MFSIHTHGLSPSTKVHRHKSPITGETTEFFAEQGLVTICGSHYKTGEEYYKRESLREFLCRAAALSLEVKHMKYGDERLAQQRLLEVMVAVAKDCKSQGDPFNPTHMSDMLKERPRQSVLGGGHSYESPAPPMPAVPDHKPLVTLGGQTLTPRQLIIPGR